MASNDQLDLLRLIEAVLWRCLALCIVFLAFWFLAILLAGDFAYATQSRWFELSRHEFELINYCGMGLLKFAATVFFLFPGLGLHLVIRKAEKGSRQ